MPRYTLSTPAKESLRSIGRYTDKTWGQAQRRLYLAALNRRFERLAEHPYEGRSHDDIRPPMRSAKEGKHVIFYFIRDDGILIVDILHESMDIAARKESWTRA